jgi:hypothetical protein
MTDDSAGQAAPGYQGAAEPAADLKALDKLVGTWELSGDVGGTVTYEWMKGGFFLIQRVNMVQEDGQENTGIEIIGRERSFSCCQRSSAVPATRSWGPGRRPGVGGRARRWRGAQGCGRPRIPIHASCDRRASQEACAYRAGGGTRTPKRWETTPARPVAVQALLQSAVQATPESTARCG